MNGPSFLEEPLLSTIDAELPRAAAELEGVSPDDLDSITEQKLILHTVREFGLENYVTTQCYLHGDVAVRGKSENRSGNAKLELPTGVDTDIPTSEEIAEQLVGPSSAYVQDALSTETFDWLESYYEEEDIPFERVYLAALPVYANLHRTRDAAMGQTSGSIPENITTVVAESCTELKRVTSRYALFDGIQPYVTEFHRAVEPFLQWTEKQDWDSSTPLEYYEEFHRLYELFYDGVWRGCGQRMSYVTVEGPSADSTRDRREREADNQHQAFRTKLRRFQMELDGLDVTAEADVDRLPDLDFDEYVFEAGTDPDISASDRTRISEPDPLFETLE
ncbi:hypothetical protein RYH80_11435 [Halobaculum sp. MBLA0147]|uniref:hypothetical protein n=1 Tax=Halobaculum sp. MBLA0147 TaxID=3079934 RepID=UPI003524C6B1